MPKSKKTKTLKNIEKVFLSEALSHASAQDISYPDKNKILLNKGSMIEPRTISLLAAHGIDRIFVFKKPRISILVMTGDLISPGLPPVSGKGYDFSVAALNAVLETMKIRPIFVQRLNGGLKKINRIISFALNQSDMMVLVFREFEQGLRDLQRFFDHVGTEFSFSRKHFSVKSVVLKNGKKQIFCLPYDSEAIFECFENLLQPSIWKFMGRKL